MRNICRACRLRRCFESGMRKEDVLEAHNGSNQVSSTVNSNPPSVTRRSSSVNNNQRQPPSAAMLQEQYPLLARALQGYECFLSAQRSLFTVDNPKCIFSNIEYIPASKLTVKKMEKDCIPLIYTMLCDFYEPFSQLHQEAKLAVIQNYQLEFNILHRSFLTAKVFPHKSDTRCVMTCGYFIDTADLRPFLQGYVDEKDVDEYIRITGPLLTHARKFARKFTDYNVREVDLVALMSTALWNEADRQGLLTEDMVRHRESVYAEWSEDLNATFGPSVACVQIAKIMSLLVDLNQMTSTYKDTLTITQVFLSKAMCQWDVSDLIHNDQAVRLTSGAYQ